MAAFSYSALDGNGKKMAGIVDADSSRGARLILRERGLFPLEVADLTQPRRYKFSFLSSSIREHEICLITRQWATLLGSDLTMEQALSALIEQVERPVVKETLAGIKAEVVSGNSLQAALGNYAQHFPMIYRASIAAGETSGALPTIMVQLADHLERRNALRQKTLHALLYPAIVAIVALLVVIGLMIYVVPSVVAVFQQGKQTLPVLTRLMIDISAFLQQWGWWLVAAITSAYVAAKIFLRDEEIRRKRDAYLLKLPLVGRYLRTLDATRFASTLSILVGSGVPLLAALDSGRQVVTLLPLQDAIKQTTERVREGVSLSKALDQTGQFPPLLIHMIASGEATGQLHSLLDRAARLQQTDLENRTMVFTTLMEPLLLICMGTIVLAIVLAVMQPIIEMNQLLH